MYCRWASCADCVDGAASDEDPRTHGSNCAPYGWAGKPALCSLVITAVNRCPLWGMSFTTGVFGALLPVTWSCGMDLEDGRSELAGARHPRLVEDRLGYKHRLPRFFFEVPSWKAALETPLTAHFALWEFMSVDLREDQFLRLRRTLGQELAPLQRSHAQHAAKQVDGRSRRRWLRRDGCCLLTHLLTIQSCGNGGKAARTEFARPGV